MNVTEIEQKVAAEAKTIRADIAADAEKAIGVVKTDAELVEGKAKALWHKAAPYVFGAAALISLAVILIVRHRH